ncbi:MAG TPA: FAD-binding oxidoreductase, partial [Firmicutes bacterium]|nr:FAD-binding oxidoreductase [Bacillota bacterium]
MAERLEAIFGDRVRTDQLERLAYSHDMGVMPASVRGTIRAVPDAVVQPVSADEVARLVQVAREVKVPLVPRGSASAGYGGAVPARGGIVVDFVRMNRVLTVDPTRLTVKVEPGVIFQRLEEELNKHGLGLRLYPTSSPSATVGGWVAQGGTGLGSFAYGAIERNVVSLDVVTPAGELKHVAGKELDLYCSLEGTTGLIVAVELAVRRQVEDCPLAVAFPTAEALFGAVKALAETDSGIWNVSLATPQFVDLQAKVHKGAVLPSGKYILTCVAPAAEKAKAEAAVARAAKKHDGEVLPAELAAAEWKERFYPMRLKRLGPSLIPAELLLPADRAAGFLADVKKEFGDDYAFEGTMADRDHVTMLGFLLGDERRLTFSLAFTSSLVVVGLARKHGGRVFTTGMYFADHAGEVLGRERLEAVWKLVQQSDPHRLFNPGKVIPVSLDPKSPTKLLHAAMKTADVGKAMMSRLGRVFGQGTVAEDGRKLPAEVARETFVCAQCGYCRPGCTVFAASPWESNSPRGKYFLLSEYLKGRLTLDEQVADRLFTCTTCKKCDTVCQTGIPIAANWLSLRPALTRRKFENTGLAFVRENVLTKGNFWGAPNSARTTWYPAGVPNREKAKVAYWPGCWASLVMPNMPQNLVRILDKAGVDFTYLGEKETCCGLYFAVGGYQEDFARQVRRNIEEFAR